VSAGSGEVRAPWCPVRDGGTRVSSLETGIPTGAVERVRASAQAGA
jgi:hypothetical protein